MRSPRSLQDSNDLANLRVEAKQRRDDLLTLRQCSLSERYLESELSVVLDLTVQGNSRSVGAGTNQHYGVSGNLPIFMLQFHALNPNDREHRDQEVVFVVNVESVKGVKIVVPSLVTFHALYHEHKKGGVARYFSLTRERRFKVLPCGVNRKLGFVAKHSRVKPLDNVAPCEIKSALEIVDCVTNNESDIRSEVAVSKAVVEELLPRLSIEVQAGAVCVQRSAESLVDIRDVLIGPLDL